MSIVTQQLNLRKINLTLVIKNIRIDPMLHIRKHIIIPCGLFHGCTTRNKYGLAIVKRQ